MFFEGNSQDINYNSPNNQITLTNINFTGNVTIEPLTTVIIPTGVVIKLKSQKSINIKPSCKIVLKLTPIFPFKLTPHFHVIKSA